MCYFSEHMKANPREKAEVISFKADTQLAAALNALDNRSEFIRQALRMSLDHQCPLCAGAGVLDANQQRHLRAFLQHHEIHECDSCHALHLDDKDDPPPSSSRNRDRASGRRRAAAALAGLFLLASMAAGAHRHAHDDHGDATETHAPAGLCAACVFAASPLLAGGAVGVSVDRVPIRPLPLPAETVAEHGRPIDMRSRAPPSFLA